MTFQFWFAAIVFVVTFIAVATEKIHKTASVLIGSAIMLLFILPGPQAHHIAVNTVNNNYTIAGEIMPASLGQSAIVTSVDTYARYVNFDVIFTLAGMMVLVNILKGTGVFQYIAIKAAKLARGKPARTMILLVMATAVLSAFLDNVTTILLVAPITFIVAFELGVPAIPFLMAETLASNIGGAATLIGDPPNLLIGSAAGLNFMAFIINITPFIIVLMVLYCVCLKKYYKKRMSVTVEKRAGIMELDETSAVTDVSNLRRGAFVILITLIGFLVHGVIEVQPCVIAMGGAALALGICKVDVDQILEKIEWSTLFFFIGLFVLVEGAEYAGVISKVGHLLDLTTAWNPLCVILVLMWFCGIIVAFMNNVSFTAVAISVVGGFLTASPLFRGNPPLQRLLWWGLALAVCLGGNFTIIGAAANLVAAGVAEKAGTQISFKEFMKYGVPVSFVSLILASAYITIRYFCLKI